jgi:tetratricopeptide (TPR) repeat protein
VPQRRRPRAPWAVAVAAGWALAAVGPALAAGDSARAERAGRELIAAERFAEAIAVLEPAVADASQGDGVPLLVLLGRAYLGAHRALAALPVLERAAALQPDEPLILFHLAAAYAQLARFDDAERLHRRVLATGRGVAPAATELGRLLLWRGRFAEAAEVLRRAALLRPEAAEVRLDLGRALAGAGDLAGALAAHREAVRLAPAEPAARYGLARALRAAGHDGEAESELAAAGGLYRQAAERARREGRQRAGLDQAWDLLRRGDAAAAAALFAAAAESVEALGGAAAAYLALAQPARAVVALERALALAPGRDDLRLALAEARLQAETPP